ncbi:hypothetical protein MICRO8M_10206 [Microbacterium sp. 8M]|nr:hypothetical protein MICRO8M_10206 [Microbacterium sp. 8M]
MPRHFGRLRLKSISRSVIAVRQGRAIEEDARAVHHRCRHRHLQQQGRPRGRARRDPRPGDAHPRREPPAHRLGRDGRRDLVGRVRLPRPGAARGDLVGP